MAGRFRYLNVGLGFVLGFVGIKMLISGVYHLPVALSLLVIAAILATAIWLSLRAEKRDGGIAPDAEVPDPDHPGRSAAPHVADETSAEPGSEQPLLDEHNAEGVAGPPPADRPSGHG